MKGAKNLEASVENISKDELIMEVKRAKRGDKEAFCNLIRLNKVAVYRVAKAILNKEEDIEDAVSESILKAYKNIQTLKDEAFFKTWLIRIVINEKVWFFISSNSNIKFIITSSHIFPMFRH